MARGRVWLVLVLVVSVAAVSASTATATIVNPDPGIFDDDDGSLYFLPSAEVFSAELFDLLGGGVTTSFGFFFAGADVNDPGNLITIFGPEDQGAPFDQIALVDFIQGMVFDIDDGEIQSTFSGFGPIGFFMSFAPDIPVSLFTDPSLNPGGLDLAATFPFLADPSTYLIGFEAPLEGEVPVTLLFEVVSGINQIPEPGAFLILGVGLAGLGFLRPRAKDMSSPSPRRSGSDDGVH